MEDRELGECLVIHPLQLQNHGEPYYNETNTGEHSHFPVQQRCLATYSS